MVDRDDGGRSWAQRMRTELDGVAASIQFLQCRAELAKADVVEHIAADFDLADLVPVGPDNGAGSAEPIDGAALLDDLLATLTGYVVFPGDHAAIATTLWVAATHAVPAFEHAPRLVINSPEKRCGKSRLLDVVHGTCHRPLSSVNATVAAIYRSLTGDHPPTLLIDEADALFGSRRQAEQNEDLRALLNAGHQRGRPALRCVGPQQTPTEFPTFAMAALAGIGEMPDTITDRAINVTMRRRTRDEKVSQFRTRRDGPKLKTLQERLARWCAAHIAELTDAEPDMPVEDRAADTWEPLVAVADCAGGRWPNIARTACRALTDAAYAADEDKSLGVKLLNDIRDVFTERMAAFLSSADLVAALRGIEDSPWNSFDYNASKLAYRLRDFGVKPGRDATGKVRGYPLEAFADAFLRYPRQNPSRVSGTIPEQAQPFDGLFSTDGSTRQSDIPTRQTETDRQNITLGQNIFLTPLTPSDAPGARNGTTPASDVVKPSPDGAEPVPTTAVANGMCRQCQANPANTISKVCDWCA